MLYNLGIRFYGALISIASLWNTKAKKWLSGRKNWEKCLPTIPDERQVIWFHCASMGEYDQGLPVMEKLKERDPSVFLLVTFFSPSGYEFLKDKSIGDHTCYLPLDTPNNANNFVSHFKPIWVFFVKYEFWLNYIDACKSNRVSIYGLSAVFQSNQRFFKWYAGRFRNMIGKFEHFFLQNEESAEVLKSKGYSHYTVTGDTRFDRVVERTKKDYSNKIISSFVNINEPTLVVGSSWPKDEELIIPFINKEAQRIKAIIAPHEVHESHINDIIGALEVPFQRYTALDNGEQLADNTRVIILDCIGVLAFAYKYGSMAYVGGGFGSGLHNILEPAAFGLPVVFGPNYSKFPEAGRFINEKIGISIRTVEELEEAIEVFLNQSSKEKVKKFISNQCGATSKVIEYLTKQ